jgi:hypothetical protein
MSRTPAEALAALRARHDRAGKATAAAIRDRARQHCKRHGIEIPEWAARQKRCNRKHTRPAASTATLDRRRSCAARYAPHELRALDLFRAHADIDTIASALGVSTDAANAWLDDPKPGLACEPASTARAPMHALRRASEPSFDFGFA